ncbi:hypothetical protein N9V13_01440 [Betaproteobacteria bacterium]|nr:hypothetical protein [Betaproteobacteria bacterium]
MYLDSFSLTSFFLACSIFFIFQGLQLTYERFSKEMLSIKAVVGLSFLIHPLSIFFFEENKFGINTNTPLHDLNDSLIFFDIFALMLICIILSYPAKKKFWTIVTIALTPLPLFFLIAYISFSEGSAIRELNILLSLSFIIILGFILYQCIPFSQRGSVRGRFFINLNLVTVIAITLWSVWVVSQIHNELYFVTHSGLFFAWLVVKTILIALVFQFNYVVDEARRTTTRASVIEDLKTTLAETSVIKTVLYNFPAFLFLTDKDGNIIFANKIALSKLGTCFTEKRHFDSVFMDRIEEAITLSRLTYKDPNNTLRMFAVRTEKVLDEKQAKYMLWMLRHIDFDFEIFCKSIINNRDSFKITGLLDHNFAIYRMSNTWRTLISPFDKFFHSGVIWDKLRIISEGNSEITHLENTISTSKRATGWLLIRTGNAFVVTLEKIYSPDKRLFYHLHARHILQ